LQEAVVIILDVGPSMSAQHEFGANEVSSNLESAIKAVNLLAQQKCLFGKNDEIALVLVGTQGTKNDQLNDFIIRYELYLICQLCAIRHIKQLE
jgi:hypothetical protein